ncbi:MAG: hypothetical protein LBV74_09160, partial [Tannerella sp.]|nr:hypothetical protein [Tannerella sp.]
EQLIVNYTADRYQPPSFDIGDPEKYYYPVALARFHKYGLNDSLANQYVSCLGARGVFHFATVGLVRILYQFPDAPAVKQGFIPILEHQLEGNLWTSEGTENHLHMERTSGLLIAQAALKYLPHKKEEAAYKYEMMKEWVLKWAKGLYTHGEGEWNSSIYHTYSIISWLNLYDFADDMAVKKAAQAVIDFYTAEMALHYSWGTTGGVEMRGAGVTDVNRNATNYLCWLWFGSDAYGDLGMHGSQVIQSVHAILSTYRPHPAMIALARKNHLEDSWYTQTRPSYLFEDPCYVRQFFYIGKNYTLGSCISGYGGYTGATSQIVPWRMVVRRENRLPYEIGGNSFYYNEWSGKTKTPYTQHVQHKNVLIQMTLTPVDVKNLTCRVHQIVDQWRILWAQDYKKRFPGVKKNNVVTQRPAEQLNFENASFINIPKTSYVLEGQLLIADLETVFLVIHFFNNPQFISVSDSMLKNRLIIADKASLGKLCGYVAEVIEKTAYSTFALLCAEVRNKNRLQCLDRQINYHSISGFCIEAMYNDDGTFTEPIFDWGYGTTQQQSIMTSPPFRQPDWPAGKGFGKIPGFQIDGEAVDFHTSCPLFNGREVYMKDGKLQIEAGQMKYQMQYP